MWCLLKGGAYSRAAFIIKVYLFNKPVQNEKNAQKSYFELQHNVESVGIFRSLRSNIAYILMTYLFVLYAMHVMLCYDGNLFHKNVQLNT